MKKIIIAGSRNFNDFSLLDYEVKKFILENFNKEDEIEIVSGTAAGADKLGERFAEKYNFPVKKFPANWDLHGKKAGPIRNEEMAKYATHCIVFWDGESRGTKNMIENAEKYNLIYKVIRCG